MISRSQRPTRGALNQRGGSGGFRPAQMSFISSRSVAFKVAMSNLIDFYISPPLESAAEHGCAEFFVGIDHNRSELYSGLGYYWLQWAHTDTVQRLFLLAIWQDGSQRHKEGIFAL